MAAIEAASFAQMDKPSRKEVLRKYRVSGESKAAPATEQDLAALSIAVEYVDADGLPIAGTQRDSTEG